MGIRDRVGSPRGLIRYSTENSLAKRYRPRDILAHLLRPRTILYSSILMTIILATVWSLTTRIPLKVDVLRDRSTLYREGDDGLIENVFTLQVKNTDVEAHRYKISVSGIDGIDIMGERIAEVPAASTKSIPVSYTHLDVYKRQGNEWAPLSDLLHAVPRRDGSGFKRPRLSQSY